MIVKLFSVYDVKAEVYNAPMPFKTNGEALRSFSDMASRSDTMIGRHPGDFKLVVLGEFDDMTGVIVSAVPPVTLGFASEFLNSSLTPSGKPKE